MTHESSFSIEKAASLFQADPVLGAQYFDTFRSRDQLEMEKRLMLAILEDAIMCSQKYALAQSSKGKHLFREAEDWILEENSDRFFAFENICTALGLDPNYLRHGLIQGKEKLLDESVKAHRRRTGGTTKKRSKKRKYRVAA